VLNVVTHPAFRRRGVFAALAAHAVAECERQGMLFSFALPNPRSTPGFLHRLGFGDAGRVPLLVAPLDARALAAGQSGLRRLVRAIGGRLGAAVVAARRGRTDGAPLATEEVGADWPGFEALWARRRGAREVMVVHDGAFVRWRFGACPTRRYRLWIARAGGDVAGAVVTRVAPVLGVPAGLVVDLMLAPGATADAAGAALLARARAEFAAAGAGLAAALAVPHTLEHRALRRDGFLRCPRALEPQPFRVVVRPQAAGDVARVAGTLDGWSLEMGDYDVI
jgi:hypothetical protein